MTNHKDSKQKLKYCSYKDCNRDTWDNSGYCIWHAEIEGKTLSDFKNTSCFDQTSPEDAYLRSANFSGADLSSGDLSGANLRHADLSGANLRHADLSEATLFRADLSEADLSEVDLSEAILFRADLEDADLSEADLSKANLRQADLSEAILFRADLGVSDLSKADLSEAFLMGADLSEADLVEANLSKADLVEANLSKADLRHADLRHADLSEVKLWGANLSSTDFSDANLHDASIEASTESAEFGYNWVSPGTTLGEVLVPTPYTPHTYWQVPKNNTEAYFYYFTSREYREENSKYRLLDEELLKYGAYSEGRAVIEVDRRKLPNPLWESILEQLDIDDWPALIVCHTTLGFESVEITDKVFDCPNNTEFARLEQGIISDRILQDPDTLRDFLNTLYEGAKQQNIKQTMRNEIAKEWVTIGLKKLEDLIIVSTSA